jgi:hypothetical protein
MGYLLLAIENLAVSLLLVALGIALVARVRSPWLRAALAALVVLVPLAMYGLVIGLDCHLEYGAPRARVGWTVPLVLITGAFLAGAVAIVWRGLRRGEPFDDLPAEVLSEQPAARRWSSGRLGLALLAALLLHAMTLANLDSAARQQLAAVRAEADSLAMAVAPQPVPAHRNAATWYNQVIDSLGREGRPLAERPQAYRDAIDALFADPATFDFTNPQLAAFLRSRAGEIEVLKTAAAMPECYFDHNYGQIAWDTLLPEISEVRGAALLLLVHARGAAASGDARAALADLAAVHGIARHIATEPFGVTLAVASALDAQTFATLQAIVRQSAQLTAEDLAAIRIDDTFSYRRALPRTLQADEAMALNMYAAMDGRADVRAASETAFGSGLPYALTMADGGRPVDPIWVLLGIGPLYRVFLLPHDLASHRQLMNQVARLSGARYDAVQKRLDELHRQLADSGAGPLARASAPNRDFIDPAFRADAQNAVRRVALALFAYRAQHGRFPDRLAELAPQTMPIVPHDPYDEQPLRYQKTDRGWIVYSVGPDLRDDGGQSWNPDNRSGDYAFAYEGPAGPPPAEPAKDGS